MRLIITLENIVSIVLIGLVVYLALTEDKK